MTRIKYLLLSAICLVCAQAYGQSLLVYHVVGQVSYRVNGVSKPLVMNTRVTAQTSITVPYGGKVELLNEQSKQRVTIKQPGQGTIQQLSAARGNSVNRSHAWRTKSVYCLLHSCLKLRYFCSDC